MNDTIALLGVPLVIQISRHISVRPTVLFIALAFGISIGSVMTPIGNPQNLLIAIKSNISLPFLTFVKWMFIPTLVNLIINYFILKKYFKHLKIPDKVILCEKDRVIGTVNNNNDEKLLSTNAITNPHLAKISIIILLLTIGGFVISEILQFLLHIAYFSIGVIAVLGSTTLYAFSSERRKLLYEVNYSVLIFFAAMFVFTYALWTSGLISDIVTHLPNPVANHDKNNNYNNLVNLIRNNVIISINSITLSQILSNVPFVAIYSNVMLNNGFNAYNVSEWMMLAAASTIAGNLTIFGAASNIIIIEGAESRSVKAFTYLEFLKIGSVVTAINITIYFLFTTFLFVSL